MRLRLALVLLGLSLGLAACERPAGDAAPASAADAAHQDLLTGYDLLATTLHDESQLHKLELFRKLTLRGPKQEVAEVMKRLAEAAGKRAEELEELRALAPDVQGKPAASSPMGDAITEVAKDLGTHEMLHEGGSFNVRFALLQAQATRMVAAMARAIARFDPNPERVAWLESLAEEFEGYRNDLVAALQRLIEAGR